MIVAISLMEFPFGVALELHPRRIFIPLKLPSDLDKCFTYIPSSVIMICYGMFQVLEFCVIHRQMHD